MQGAGAYLEPLEDALASFLSTLLDAPLDDDGKLRTLLGHKVKQAGMGIPKPTKFAASVFETSLSAYSKLIRSLRHRIDIDMDAHKRGFHPKSHKIRGVRPRKIALGNLYVATLDRILIPDCLLAL